MDPRIKTEKIAANNLNFEVLTCGEGDKLALCLHGFPEHAISWRFQLPMLADLGYKAWAPNLRGYGNSDRPPFVEDYALEKLMADVAGLIDASGCRETVLIAHDWGAIIAWYFAIREIRPLTKLVICNVPHPEPLRQAMRTWKQLKKSWYAMFFQIPGLPEWLLTRNQAQPIADMFKNSVLTKDNYSPEVIDIFRQSAAQPGAMRAMINYYRALVRGGGQRQEKLGCPVIETPTLMLWGTDDLALSIESTYGTEQYVRHLTLRYLDRISHWVNQDAPLEVNTMITAFLKDESVPEMKWEMTLSKP